MQKKAKIPAGSSYPGGRKKEKGITAEGNDEDRAARKPAPPDCT
jgi:hypothetical protein